MLNIPCYASELCTPTENCSFMENVFDGVTAKRRTVFQRIFRGVAAEVMLLFFKGEKKLFEAKVEEKIQQ